MKNLVPVVLCGGAGSRLWPLSRQAYPKQFLDLTGSGESLLQATLSRLSGLTALSAPIVVCNEQHRFLVADQLQRIGIERTTLLLEPVARNTAPAVALAALSAQATDPDAVLLVLPADHVITGQSDFHRAINSACAAAEKGRLVTFGVVPTHAETGYGYIERAARLVGDSEVSDACSIKQFAEKPDLATAQAYLADESFLWNSGMFVFRASQYLEELEAHEPDMLALCQQALAEAETDLDFTRIAAGPFGDCPANSIDYAVMEKTQLGAVVPLDAGWSDIGSFSGLWDISAKDAQSNVTLGDVLLEDTQDSYVYSDSRLVAAVGLDNAVIVETADAVLVADRNRVQDVKTVVTRLKSLGRDESVLHKTVYRPWGSYASICESDRFQVKKIVVNPGQKLSLQKHHHRAEHWIVVKGTARVTCEDKVFMLNEDQSTYIPIGDKHRLENPGKIPLELIEVQSGSYLGEDDIVRYDDVYGREK